MIQPLFDRYPPPPPMPEVRGALLMLDEARTSLGRHIWNKAQLEDCIRSAEFFINEARRAAGLEKGGAA